MQLVLKPVVLGVDPVVTPLKKEAQTVPSCRASCPFQNLAALPMLGQGWRYQHWELWLLPFAAHLHAFEGFGALTGAQQADHRSTQPPLYLHSQRWRLHAQELVRLGLPLVCEPGAAAGMGDAAHSALFLSFGPLTHGQSHGTPADLELPPTGGAAAFADEAGGAVVAAGDSGADAGAGGDCAVCGAVALIGSADGRGGRAVAGCCGGCVAAAGVAGVAGAAGAAGRGGGSGAHGGRAFGAHPLYLPSLPRERPVQKALLEVALEEVEPLLSVTSDQREANVLPKDLKKLEGLPRRPEMEVLLAEVEPLQGKLHHSAL